jgi:DNA-directed RNA polymerase specialized sigma24 family protein
VIYLALENQAGPEAESGSEEEGWEEVSNNPNEVNLNSSDTLESLTEKAISGDDEALTLLVEHPQLKKVLNDVSKWAEKKFKQDRDEIRDFLTTALYYKIETVSNPRRLDLWLSKVAKSYSLNEIRRKRKEHYYIVEIEHDRYDSKKRNDYIMVQSTPVPTPEQELLDKERASLMENAVRKATKSFPPKMVDAWASGRSVKEIIEETGMPASTVYRTLKKMQKAIISEIETMRNQDEDQSRYPLRGTLLFYNDSTAPVGEDDWNAMK